MAKSRYGFEKHDELLEVLERKGAVVVHFETDSGNILELRGRLVNANKRYLLFAQSIRILVSSLLACRFHSL